MSEPTARNSLTRRISGQAALLMAAFGLGQGLSLARNALLGHWLSRSDFGIAATITLALQLTEMLSDLGVDRHIVQSKDGDDEKLQAAGHAVLVGRGVLTALVLYLCAGPIASFFHVEDAAWAFQLAALAPLIRGFSHLDVRRFQRRFDNRAFVLIEVVPQAAALALMLPALHVMPGYEAVAVVLVVQAAIAWAATALLAERRYRLDFDVGHMKRMLAFGWPIWLSAFPLVAVYQGERVIVGRMFGVEALAAFTVTFMATMLPGLAAGKIGHALMLPLLSAVSSRPRRFLRRVRVMSEATTIAAAVYVSLFVIAGEALIPIAFGPAYHGLGALAGCLAMMWSLRIIQAVPGIALMSIGVTGPLLVAGCLRALALPAALWLALEGASLPMVALAGVGGEAVSLVYVCFALGRRCPGLAGVMLRRSLFLVPGGTAAVFLSHTVPAASGVVLPVAVVIGLSSALVMAGLAVMPGIRRMLELRLRSHRSGWPFASRKADRAAGALQSAPRSSPVNPVTASDVNTRPMIISRTTST